MSKPPKIVIPGLNRGAGIPPGYVLGRPSGTGKGPAQLLNLLELRRVGLATAAGATQSTSTAISTAHSETVSLSSSVSTAISGSISTVNSRIDSLSTAGGGGGGTGTSTSLSQISSSLSSEISTDLSRATSLSTVISGSISTVNSRVDSLSTAGGGGGGSTPWYINVPLAASFSTTSGDATQLVLTDNADVGLIANCGAPVSGQITRLAYKTLSNKALDWEVTVRLLCAAPNIANTGLSVYLMDSVGGRLVSYDLLRETNVSGVFYWGSLASFTSNPFAFTPMLPIKWVRITATGASLSFQFSENGKQWVELFSVGITAHLANRPDRIGFGSNTNRTSSFRNMLTANYFTLTGPAV